ncbi:hypothetical protein HZS38_16105 [Xenorhabdus nematophila]|uniref:Uncharacterized protein n=1 Tax=Xenorhabdus nematophila (strain ATCC 19061 / DSM 3370 / CCUG 14189 / LMG 1036 / NCIMB 9965 / AN6) TaxID=406817 RepID=D3VF91_XENNA|nr:hypothetical protein [Xenorhabdus nematophila]CEF29176.1 hypothetical protein XNW1_1580002 [Xenorhabdus nematophila str. Websteri]AYA41856.1 hypothetical protein D3790_16620 [Xenorhabdus nematophila]MBA0020588.1 hypothetical protein [Xenorhabdus nematophila]MCB4424627.1 hypothetical protein [Xenorhabdus nematophila]QNJ36229.1 hypothetical protein H8F46_16245 [Xenorhabdus nematophila]
MNIPMQYSLSHNADLIKGQSFTLTVTLNIESDTDINGNTISFKNYKYITPPNNTPLNLSDDKKTAIAYCDIIVHGKIPKNEKIIFDVDTTLSGYQSGHFECTPRTIDENTLILTVDNNFLDLPSGENNPSLTGTTCSNILGETYCTESTYRY